MAILKGGINGPFSGKVGSIVGYELNGQTIIRSLPRIIKRKPSALTVLNRNRLKAVSKFLKPISGVINFGYKNIAPAGSRIGPFQTAQSYHFKHAIDYDDNNEPYINPEKALIFRGNLVQPIIQSITKDKNILTVTWQPEIYQHKDYFIVALAYSPHGDCDFYNAGTLASKGQLKWELLQHFDDRNQVHVYLAVVDIISNELSDSVYLGYL